MQKLFLGVIAAGLLSPIAQVATAGGEGNPFNGPPSNRLIFPLFRKQSLPAFQAAPWYLYWPYNGHFQTPAPLFGGYGGGGYGGGGQVNPYFQQYTAPAAVAPAAQPQPAPAPMPPVSPVPPAPMPPMNPEAPTNPGVPSVPGTVSPSSVPAIPTVPLLPSGPGQ